MVTGYCFNGKATKTNPINVYGVAKLCWEKACINANPNAILLHVGLQWFKIIL
jgi:dTDP-4-dehydrorhamnose reductase